MAHAWMPGARRIRARTDGGPLRGGAPRAVWLTLGTAPRAVSVQSAAQRLVSECRPCHLIWDPLTGEIVQLISILRAGRALGAPEQLDCDSRLIPVSPPDINAQGRICVQIGVLGHPAQPFTGGPMIAADRIVNWLDSWGVSRSWPAGQPADCRATRSRRSRALWARGGHYGASQVPVCGNLSPGLSPGAIDIDRLTRSHAIEVPSQRPLEAELADALPVPV